MKYVFVFFTVLLVACSNPTDVNPVTEYTIHYDVTSSGGVTISVEWYNPEMGSIESFSDPAHSGVVQWETIDYIAVSGQVLYVRNISIAGVGKVRIHVDNVVVAESAESDSACVEYRLP
jgi:hypothetical protein